jgi:adenylosuccinate synthase
MINDGVKETFSSWFRVPGANVLVDGQFGSTGKGLLAGVIALAAGGRITHVTTNAGPNSGHTAFWGDTEVMTQQIPVASVFLHNMGKVVPTTLNAGAVIDEDILRNECNKYGFNAGNLFIHPQAAVITAGCRLADQAVVNSVAGTGKGIGPAVADKVMRRGVRAAHVYNPCFLPPQTGVDATWDNLWDWRRDRVFVETAQGFSLGVNRQFAPNSTSRECTVMQALADASIPAQMLRKVVACFRTFPIRVGNTQTGNSGGCYHDQAEVSWEALGLTPELTTVTKRVRRVFTWSRQQFRDAIAANRPDVVFLNFCNYLTHEGAVILLGWLFEDYFAEIGEAPQDILLGFGPRSEDVYSWNAVQHTTLLEDLPFRKAAV